MLSYRFARLGIDSWALLKRFTNSGSDSGVPGRVRQRKDGLHCNFHFFLAMVLGMSQLMEAGKVGMLG